MQAQLTAQQCRQQAMTAEAQLALSRQKLRQQLAAAARPLAMSGWEDLVDEAAADLEKVEGHVAAAAQRVIELQVRGRVGVSLWQHTSPRGLGGDSGQGMGQLVHARRVLLVRQQQTWRRSWENVAVA
jgi:hypothetical protein